MRRATLHLDGWAGRVAVPVDVIGATPARYRVQLVEGAPPVRLPGRRVLAPGAVALVPKSAITLAPVARRDSAREE